MWLPALEASTRAGWTQGCPWQLCLGASWLGGCGTAKILVQTSWLFGIEFFSQFPVVPELVRLKQTHGCLLQFWQ